MELQNHYSVEGTIKIRSTPDRNKLAPVGSKARDTIFSGFFYLNRPEPFCGLLGTWNFRTVSAEKLFQDTISSITFEVKKERDTIFSAFLPHLVGSKTWFT